MADTDYEKQLIRLIVILRGQYTPAVGDPEYVNIAVDSNGYLEIEGGA